MRRFHLAQEDPSCRQQRMTDSEKQTTTNMSQLCSQKILLLALFAAMVSPAASFRYDEKTNSIFPSSSLSSSSSSSGAGAGAEGRDIKVFYQTGTSDADLPVCSPNSVCNKLDTYGKPWVEKQCRCPSGMSACSSSAHPKDGYTVMDRTKQYKTCEPVKRLKKCKYFRDITWSLITYPDNTTQQVMHCRCPKNSVPYFVKRVGFKTPEGKDGFQYNFACSPQSRLKCQRKEPCRLFSVRQSSRHGGNTDEASLSTLCSCPRRKKCPKHHLDVGVIPGKMYDESEVRTYSAYCI